MALRVMSALLGVLLIGAGLALMWWPLVVVWAGVLFLAAGLLIDGGDE